MHMYIRLRASRGADDLYRARIRSTTPAAHLFTPNCCNAYSQ